jgi:hypothetical protein
MDERDHEEYVTRQADEIRNMNLLGNEENDEITIQQRIMNLVDSGIPEDEADKIVRESYYENFKRPKYERQIEGLKKKKQMEEEERMERIMNEQKINEELDKKNKKEKEKTFRGILEYLARIRDIKFENIKNKISDFTKNADLKIVLSSSETDDLEKILDSEGYSQYLKRKKVSDKEKYEEKQKMMDFIDYEMEDYDYDYASDYEYEEGGSKRTTRKRKTQIRKKLRKNKRKQTRKRKNPKKKSKKT